MHCRSCLATKPPSDFYASNKTRCKECVKTAVAAHRLANIERVRSYDRLRSSMPHRIAAREQYAKTKAYAEGHAAAAKRWQAKHPERRAAHITLGNAIRSGAVTPWPVCEVPECDAMPHAHHPHYGAPLLVTWLCPTHHRAAHALVEEAV